MFQHYEHAFGMALANLLVFSAGAETFVTIGPGGFEQTIRRSIAIDVHGEQRFRDQLRKYGRGFTHGEPRHSRRIVDIEPAGKH